MKHTPGPWFSEKRETQWRIRQVGCMPHEMSVALIPIDNKPNADLVSAAPELLGALMKALPLLEAFSNGAWLEARKEAKAAILKAIGGAR